MCVSASVHVCVHVHNNIIIDFMGPRACAPYTCIYMYLYELPNGMSFVVDPITLSKVLANISILYINPSDTFRSTV